MKSDPGLDTVRATRTKISRQHGNDPKRLVEFYMDYQRRFEQRRLRWAPGTQEEAAAEPSAAGDGEDAAAER